jgi:hypothetical protein
MLSLTLAALLLLPTRTDAGLEEALARARASWRPYVAAVAGVRWCRELECAEETGGGKWEPETRTIIIWPGYPWPCANGLDLVMLHEYGHALGLEHVDRKERLSIMNQGWKQPYGEVPSPADLAAVGKLRGL